MGCLGNTVWFLCSGLWQGISWGLAGVLWSITIVGIPIGKQCFKLASLVFFSVRERDTVQRKYFFCDC